MPPRGSLSGALGLLEEREAQGNDAGAKEQHQQGICGHDVPGNAQRGNDAGTCISSQAGNGHSLSRAATLLS